MFSQTLKAKLDPDVRRDVENILLQRCEAAQTDAQDRNERLKNLALVLEGEKLPRMGEPWPNACSLVEPVVWTEVVQLHANMVAPLKRDPLVEASARFPGDEEKAVKQEAWLADTWRNEGFYDQFAFALWNLKRDHCAVMYYGWAEKVRQKRTVRYWDGESEDENGDPITLESDPTTQAGEDGETLMAEETGIYLPLPHLEPTEKQRGGDYRVVDEANFYLYPSNAPSVDRAEMVFERWEMSEAELLDGISDYDFDEEAVLDLRGMGPTRPYSGTETDREQKDDRQGITPNEAASEDGVYECFLFFGRLPKLWETDGTARLPKWMWQDDFMGVICPAHNKVILLDFSPYAERPYFMWSLISEANRAMGAGIVQKLEGYAYEATHLVRNTLDSLDMGLQTPVIMDDGSAEENEGASLFPGAQLTEKVPGGIRFPEMPNNAALGFEGLNMVLSRAKAVASNQSFGQIDQKVRRVAEIQNAMFAADEKFDLYQWNAFRVIPQMAARRIAMELQFNGNLDAKIRTPQGEVQVKASDLEGTFRYSVSASNANSNPDAQREKTQLKLQIQANFIQGVSSLPPQWHPQLYHGARQALLDLGERDVEKWIGKEPPPFDPMAGMGAGMPMGGAPMPGQGLPGMEMGQMGAMPPMPAEIPMQGAPV